MDSPVNKKTHDIFKRLKILHYQPNKTYTYVIYGTMLLIFLLVSLYYIKNISLDSYINTTYSIDLTSKGQKSNYEIGIDTCPAGYCAQSRDSGIKRCPEDVTAILNFDSALEVCTPSNMCLSQPYTNPVKSDGGTIPETKICLDGSNCRCLKDTFCSDYVSVVFEGSPFSDEKTYQQIVPNTEEAMTNLPYDFSTQKCIITPGYTNKILNGCDFGVDLQDPIDGTGSGGESSNYKNMLLCLTKNPCSFGQFAYNSDRLSYNNGDGGYRNFLQFKPTSKVSYTTGNSMNSLLEDVSSHTLSCVYSKPCYGETTPDETRFYPYYDKNLYYLNNLANYPSLGFNDTKMSLYYPVWSNERRRNECVRMYPLAMFDVSINGGVIISAVIRASGRDFSHYILHTDSKFHHYVEYNKSNFKDGVLELEFYDINKNLIVGASAYISNITDGKIVSVTIVSGGSGLSGKPYAVLTGFAPP